jgi:DNA-binding NarL/FixJ family response regulator
MPVRILIVDDSPSVRNLLRKMLEGQPALQVCGEAANGKEGIEMPQAISPDLIVLDLSMPVMNGLDAARILSREMPKTRLIMFTTFCAPHIEHETLSPGVTKVISKSGPTSELIECAHALRERRRVNLESFLFENLNPRESADSRLTLFGRTLVIFSHLLYA